MCWSWHFDGPLQTVGTDGCASTLAACADAPWKAVAAAGRLIIYQHLNYTTEWLKTLLVSGKWPLLCNTWCCGSNSCCAYALPCSARDNGWFTSSFFVFVFYILTATGRQRHFHYAEHLLSSLATVQVIEEGHYCLAKEDLIRENSSTLSS